MPNTKWSPAKDVLYSNEVLVGTFDDMEGAYAFVREECPGGFYCGSDVKGRQVDLIGVFAQQLGGADGTYRWCVTGYPA